MRLTSKCHPSVGLDSYCPELVLSSIQVLRPSPAETDRNKTDNFYPRSHVDTSLSAVDERALLSPALMHVADSCTFSSADRGDDGSWAPRSRWRSVTQRQGNHSHYILSPSAHPLLNNNADLTISIEPIAILTMKFIRFFVKVMLFFLSREITIKIPKYKVNLDIQ